MSCLRIKNTKFLYEGTGTPKIKFTLFHTQLFFSIFKKNFDSPRHLPTPLPCNNMETTNNYNQRSTSLIHIHSLKKNKRRIVYFTCFCSTSLMRMYFPLFFFFFFYKIMLQYSDLPFLNHPHDDPPPKKTHQLFSEPYATNNTR